MTLRSAMAALNSLALIFARTAARSGASRVVGVSTAFTEDTRAGRTQSAKRLARHTRKSVEVLMVISFVSVFCSRRRGALPHRNAPAPPLRLHGSEGISAAILGKSASPWEGEVSAADHHLVSDDAVDELAARLHRERAVLIVGALPLRMRREQRGDVSRVVGDHELLVAAADVECHVPRRMAGRIDEANTRCHLRLLFDQLEVLPAGERGVDASSQLLSRLRQLLDPTGLGPPLELGGVDDQLGVGGSGR